MQSILLPILLCALALRCAAHGNRFPSSLQPVAGYRPVVVPPSQVRRTMLTYNGIAPLECNQYSPCPSGYTCALSPLAPGVMSCFSNLKEGGKRRAGNCPADRGARLLNKRHGHSQGFYRVRRCLFDEDCPSARRCCTQFSTLQLTCVDAAAAPDKQAVVTVLVAGTFAQKADAVKLSDGNASLSTLTNVGTVTLVQSGKRNILVDTGAPGQRAELMTALRAAGVTPADIDYIVLTHAYPDHWGNAAAFDAPYSVPMNFDNFEIRGKLYIRRWKRPDVTPRFYVFGDANVEITKPVNITIEDDYVIVYNVKDLGTVVIAGDVFYTEDDLTNNDQTIGGLVLSANAEDISNTKATRKAVACVADYVVPGHGPMFKMRTGSSGAGATDYRPHEIASVAVNMTC